MLIDDGMFGEVSIVTARPRIMSAHARSTCYLAFVNKNDEETILMDLKAILLEANQRIPPFLKDLEPPGGFREVPPGGARGQAGLSESATGLCKVAVWAQK